MRYGLLFIWLMCLHPVLAQKKCKDVLNRSDKLFQDGQIQDAAKLCESCLRSLKTDEERFEAYRLLGISYQFLNNKKKAYYYAEMMIRLKPDYRKYPNIDPVEFTRLIEKFEVKQTVYGGLKTGMNYTSPTILKNYSPFNAPSTYYLTTGYQFGGFAEYFIRDKITLGMDFLFNGIYLNQTLDNIQGNSQRYSESQQYLLILPHINFYLPLSNGLRVYSGGGFGLNYMLNAMINLENRVEQTGVTTLNSRNAIDERNRAQILTSIKMGISYPLGKGFVAIDCSYMIYFRNLIDEDQRFRNLDFIFYNQYINDDIRLSMFQFNLSYHLPLHSIIIQKTP